MNIFEQLLSETRRIYKKLPKLSAYSELEPYKDKDDYYISFTDIERIGINPRSQFRTPLGIYMYPLKEAWKRYYFDDGKTVGKSVPFAGDRPNIYLVKLKDNVKFVKKASDYSEDDLTKDLATLRGHILGNKEKYHKSFFVNSPEELTVNILERKFNEWSKEAKLNHTPITKLWNITRNLSFRGRDVDDCSNSERTSIITNWNTLLYKVLGYYGFADKEGTGYIHDYEPVQAVFFTKSAFTVVKLTPNKEIDNKKNSWLSKALNSGKVKTKSAKIGFDEEDDWPYWHSGTWIDGIWKGGSWYNGTWESGTWESGAWFKGTWYNGTWKSGSWRGGIWKNGIWKGGAWKNGVWNKGTWESGVWQDGLWYGGSWLDGIWHGGAWYGGTWHYGVWEGGFWHGGRWKGGKIHDKEKKGNYEPSWKWVGEYVQSPISPAEYWKGVKK